MGKIFSLFLTAGIIALGVYFSGLFTGKSVPQNLSGLEIPHIRSNDVIIPHSAYSLSYNEGHEQANWVAYELTREELADNFSRNKMRFKPDPDIPTGSAEDDDYRNSGYDRGHLAPAGDMNFSEQALRESFYFSNISPQQKRFNSGIWKKLEDLVRDWAQTYGSVFIVTGPVLEKNLTYIGRNRVSVPRYFYKAVLINNGKQPPGAVAFVIENISSKAPLRNYMITIDSLESLISLDLFPKLDDSVENRIESKISLNYW